MSYITCQVIYLNNVNSGRIDFEFFVGILLTFYRQIRRMLHHHSLQLTQVTNVKQMAMIFQVIENLVVHHYFDHCHVKVILLLWM